MSFLHRPRHEWLSADVIATQSEVERRLSEQIISDRPPATVSELKAGTDLFQQGFFAQAVHLVLDGEVSVSVDGAEVARAMRQKLPNVPILFFSGYADTAALEAAVGKTPLLRKPVRPSELAAEIRTLLDQRPG